MEIKTIPGSPKERVIQDDYNEAKAEWERNNSEKFNSLPTRKRNKLALDQMFHSFLFYAKRLLKENKMEPETISNALMPALYLGIGLAIIIAVGTIRMALYDSTVYTIHGMAIAFGIMVAAALIIF